MLFVSRWVLEGGGGGGVVHVCKPNAEANVDELVDAGGPSSSRQAT